MKMRFLCLFFACILLMASASCGLVGPAGEKPVNAATSRAAVRLRLPTDTPAPPTATPPPEAVVKDLGEVQLVLEDFPAGFKAMSFTEMDQLGMTPTKLAASFTKDLTKAKVIKPTGFMHQEGKSMDLVLSLVIYPLTGLEVSGYDLAMAEPEKFMADFATPGSSDSRLLEGGQAIGEKSIAVDYKLAQESPSDIPSRGQIILVRRGNAILLVFNIYFNSQIPGVDGLDLARSLDARLANALAQ